MGCLGSKGMLSNEARKDVNDSKENLSKKNESSIKKKTNNGNLITSNCIFKENNDTKEEENKDTKEKKKSDINEINENINKNKESNNEIKDEEEETNINLIYYAAKKGLYPILGNDFIENNKDSIKIIVNNKQEELEQFHEFRQGDNFISIIIKKS